MKAIATIAANPPCWAPITIERMREYARRTGSDFILLEPTEWRGYIDKKVQRDVVASYDQCLLIDLDVVISRAAPAILGVCPHDTIWMTLDAEPGDVHCKHRIRDIVMSQAILGAVRWVGGYGNSGVIVASRRHADAWSDWLELPTTLIDQTILNYRIRQLGMKFGWLDRNWNSMAINNDVPDCISSCEAIARGAFFAHAAGFPSDQRQGAIEAFDRLLP
jgi:hypothetical protein